ncbi:MAG: MFS transporter [Methylobacterium sp.]|nr:MAG: MFS transporter [Methylobacterium sp.]
MGHAFLSFESCHKPTMTAPLDQPSPDLPSAALPLNRGERLRVILSAVAIVTLVGVSLSVSGPLLALEMERWGTPSTLAGLTATLAGVGNLMFVPFVPRIASRFGVKALVATMLLLSSALHLAFWAMPYLWVWAAFRFVLGASIGTLFVLSEYWISAAADPQRRGFIMGAYATALALGFAIGPLMLTVTGTQGVLPYAATAALILTGLLPLTLIGPNAASVHGSPRASVLSYVRLAPAATLAALTVGAIEIGAFTQLPVHGLRMGWPEASAAILVSAFAIGNVLFQMPIGWLADRIDRRKILLVMSVTAACLAASLPLTGAVFWPHAALLMLLGGLVGALYTVGLAHLSARFANADLVSANAAFVMLYSVGQMTGPPLLGAGLDIAGVYGVPAAMALVLGLYGAVVASRLRAGPARG